METRLKSSRHTEQAWRIGEVAHDFELIDVWALPTTGTAGEFSDLCSLFSSIDLGADRRSMPSRILFATRTWLGQRLGWDDAINTLPIPGCLESSLRDRLPPDLEAETSETAGQTPFRPVYRTEDEWALELSNSTVHAVLHLGWVSKPDGTFQGQLGVYAKPRGRLGRPYMTLIAPFRHHIVYPALLRRLDREWKSRSSPSQ